MKVKILLTADIKGVGKKGEIVEVSRGYATNYILPKKLGIIATEQVINDFKSKEEAKLRRFEKEKKLAEETASRIDSSRLTIKRKAGEAGKLFGAVTQKEIAEAIRSQIGINIDKKSIEISTPIKSVGEFEVSVDLGFGYKAKIYLIVEAE
ncbi:MAG: 50S ribosomal protein L9 [Actinobacteria bacterium]|nr:50S ribosomal protein L9 [Actinomycetota bacterium]